MHGGHLKRLLTSSLDIFKEASQPDESIVILPYDLGHAGATWDQNKSRCWNPAAHKVYLGETSKEMKGILAHIVQMKDC